MMQAIALSDTGKVRENNQDSVYISEGAIGALPDLFMVADGMGGEQAGDYCSRSLIERILKQVEESRGGEPVRILRAAIELANRELYRESIYDASLSGMGSTLVAAMIENDTLYVFNVGDSRLYLLNGKLRQITRDHSFVEEMVSAGRMQRGSLDYLRNKNIITRAVGIGMTIDPDVFEIPLEKGSKILLCTDGLTNMLSDSRIEETILHADGLRDAAEKLIDGANREGGVDNISVVLVDTLDSGTGGADPEENGSAWKEVRP